MQTFDQALMKLVTDGAISQEEALHASSNPHELALRLGGIEASSDQSWNAFEGTPAPSGAQKQTSGKSPF
jgi:Tfp pilus assembly ATPase PilU